MKLEQQAEQLSFDGMLDSVSAIRDAKRLVQAIYAGLDKAEKAEQHLIAHMEARQGVERSAA